MSGLTPDLVIYLMNQGIRQTDIAREYGVSRQYVYKLAKKGGHVSPITTVTENMPWDVDNEFLNNHLYQSLRLYGHSRVEGEDALNGSSLTKLNAFKKKIIHYGLVVDYDPDYPAVPGVVNLPGFALLHRTEQDEDFVIKIRPGVRITPLGDKIWRLPRE